MSFITNNKHKCQIDCTNHDEVVHNLEIKSKQLYLFWRNYEWLYKKYYEQRQEPSVVHKESHDHCQKQIDELQTRNENLAQQNKRLKLELDSCKKQLGDLRNSHPLEQSYTKQVEHWKKKCSEYEQIKESLTKELQRIKRNMKEQQEDAESQKSRLTKQIKKHMQTISQLQQSMDELRRSQMSKSVPHTNQQSAIGYGEMEQFSRRQSQTISTRIVKLGEEAQRMIYNECEILKRELEDKILDVLGEISQRELQSIIVVLEQ